LGLASGCHLVVVLLDPVAELLQLTHHLGADVLLGVGRLDREVPLLVARLVAEVPALDDLAGAVVHRVALAAGVPLPLGGVDQVEAGVLVLLVAHLVEDEELGLGTEVGDVANAGRVEIGLGLARDVARVARVVLLRDRVDDVADEAEGGNRREGVHHGGRGIGHDEHVRRVDRLPAADRRAVEAVPLLEKLLAQFAGRDREVLPEAEQVEEFQVHRLDLAILRERQHVLCRLCCHAHASCCELLLGLLGRLGDQMASLPRSPVRMRMISSIGRTKIFPSPMRPVLAAFSMASTTSTTCSSRTMISSFTLGRKSTTYSAPRYSSVWPFCRPNPFTSLTVRPCTPMPDRLSFTSSSLKGLMIASTFFMAIASNSSSGTPVSPITRTNL